MSGVSFSGYRSHPGGFGPLALVAASALAVTLIAFNERTVEERLGLWPSGFILAQITLLALWTSWSADAVWKRWTLVAACLGLPMYFVLLTEWWQGGGYVEKLVGYEFGIALLLLFLIAILMPIRWMIGCRLSFSRQPIGPMRGGRFGLAQLFGLTLIVALALALIASQAGGSPASELLWPLLVLTLLIVSILATVLPSLWAVFSARWTSIWLLLLAAYLCLAAVAEVELFCHLNRIFRDPDGMMDREVRGWLREVALGFAMTFLVSLIMLRLMGMRLLFGALTPEAGASAAAVSNEPAT
jgi:hypothetical protein